MTDWTTTNGRLGQRGFGTWEVTDENRLPDDFCDKCLEQGCSCPRLQQLFAEFEAEASAILDDWHDDILDMADPIRNMPLRDHFWFEELVALDPFDWAHQELNYPTEPKLQAYAALYEKPALVARRYIIARDFLEFREDKWELLWKLTYGGSL